MSDKDNPEIPPTPKPFEPPQPKGNTWDVFNRIKVSRKPLNEGDPNYVPGLDERKPLSDEELMRAAAIKCTEMEDEISTLLNEQKVDLTQSANEIPISPRVFINYTPRVLGITSQNESIGERGNTAVQYAEYVDTDPEYVNELGIRTNRELIIDINTDKSIQVAINSFREKEGYYPLTKTHYFFTNNGDYRKAITIMKGVNLNDETKKPLHHPKLNIAFKIFESEMTPHDFEIAGQALVMLKNRLLEAQEQTPPEPQQ